MLYHQSSVHTGVAHGYTIALRTKRFMRASNWRPHEWGTTIRRWTNAISQVLKSLGEIGNHKRDINTPNTTHPCNMYSPIVWLTSRMIYRSQPL